MEITREIATKVRDTVDAGLVNGVGNPVPGQMCVEAAVCFALDLPHGDDPGCVAQSLRRLKIRLNDSRWSSNKARAKGLRRLALAQLGSAGVLDEKEFVRRVVDVTIRKAVPIGLRAAASRFLKKWPDHAAKLEAAAVRCEVEGTRKACEHARAIARAAAYAADAADADAYAAYDAYADAYAAAAAAAYADAAAAAAYADAAAAYADAADAADAAARTRNRVLAEYAEWIVEILIDMDAPGCQFLDLVPVAHV